MPLSADVEFLDELTKRFPQLAEDYEIHVENNGIPLPLVFFDDVTLAVVAAYEGTDLDYAESDWRGFLDFLDSAYPTAQLDVKEVIVTSFLLQLPWPEQPGYGIVDHLGPVLTQKFREVRPGG